MKCLAKIFSCCVINMHTHSVHIVRISSQSNILVMMYAMCIQCVYNVYSLCKHTLQSNIFVNSMTKVNDLHACVQAKVKSLQSKLCCLVVFFLLLLLFFFLLGYLVV